MPKKEAQHIRLLDNIQVQDSTWLDLGQLRSLVRLADERAWLDSSLVSTSPGREHPSRRDLRIATNIVLEGSDPQQ